MGVFNNRDSAQCNSYNIGNNQSFQNCSNFILVSVIFICLVYLFTLIVYLESSLSYIVRVKSRTICGYLHILLHISLIFLYANHFWFFKIAVKLSGDVEENPGPKPSSSQSFSICHWNLNSISAHNYMKLSLLRAYLSTHKFDVICISETYLNSDTSTVDENLEIAGYTLIRADHPSNTKRGGVCIYYKHSLAFKLLDICYLEECINFEISFGGKLCNFISLYRSPSQSLDVFEKFADNFELNLDKVTNKNPYLIVILGDFNAKSSNWYKHDTTTYEGSKIDAITSQFGLKQLIQEPTHILTDSSSCIDLIFTSQPNLVMESGVHSSLHQNCHHQLLYTKVNLKVSYPPPYLTRDMALSTCKC